MKHRIIAGRSPDATIAAASLNRSFELQGLPTAHVSYISPKGLAEELGKIRPGSPVYIVGLIMYDTHTLPVGKAVRRIVENDGFNPVRFPDSVTLYSSFYGARNIAQTCGINAIANTSLSATELVMTTESDVSPFYAAVAARSCNITSPFLESVERKNHIHVKLGALHLKQAYLDHNSKTRNDVYNAALLNRDVLLSPQILESSLVGASKMTQFEAGTQIRDLKKLPNIMTGNLDGVDGSDVVGCISCLPSQEKTVIFTRQYNQECSVVYVKRAKKSPWTNIAKIVHEEIGQLGGIGGGSLDLGSGILETRLLQDFRRNINARLE